MNGKKFCKGQIFSLDLIISIAIIILAIGLLLRFAEVNAYNLKDEEIRKELELVGFSAIDRLGNDPVLNCVLEDSVGASIGKIPNCISQGTDISKTDLGIPDSYNCRLTSSNLSSIGQCDGTPAAEVENVFGMKKTILISAAAATTKAELEDCLEGNCNGVLMAEVIELQVWK